MVTKHIDLDQYLLIPFLVGWPSISSINPSYFDVNYWGTLGFDTLPHPNTMLQCALQTISATSPGGRHRIWRWQPTGEQRHTSCFPEISPWPSSCGSRLSGDGQPCWSTQRGWLSRGVQGVQQAVMRKIMENYGMENHGFLWNIMENHTKLKILRWILLTSAHHISIHVWSTTRFVCKGSLKNTLKFWCTLCWVDNIQQSTSDADFLQFPQLVSPHRPVGPMAVGRPRTFTSLGAARVKCGLDHLYVLHISASYFISFWRSDCSFPQF